MCFGRRQHEQEAAELWPSEGQVRLLGQGSLRAVAAGRGHHQDPLQEGSQWLVERRGLRQGEGFVNIRVVKNNSFSGTNGPFLIRIALFFPGGALPSQLCGGGLLWLLLMWLHVGRRYVDPVLYMYIPLYTVCVGSVRYLVSIALTHMYKCDCTGGSGARQLMWIKLFFSWSDEFCFWLKLVQKNVFLFYPGFGFSASFAQIIWLTDQLSGFWMSMVKVTTASGGTNLY